MRIIGALAVFVCTSASAAGMNCSIQPSEGARDADLPTLAKISMADARRTALKAVNAPPDAKPKGELEVESGCLLYSFDIKIPKKHGVEEVMIDAGDGKVLSRKHESPIQEAAEQAKDHFSSKRK